ncbi:hypothetical protein NCS52_01148200 [Fusarium sp. LHS14.1]|nr:hypothetical protein NCS52_01148200 [Fusarium sp. LHS14.1]
MGNSESKPGIAPQMSPEGQQKGVPPIIRASYQNTWSQLICWTSVSLNLGEPDAKPTYSVSLPKGWYGDIILHNGPSTDSAPLASGSRDRVCRTSDYSITLPPLPGSDFDGGLEILRRPSGRKGRWWFGIKVGQGAGQQVERFEWRRSHGSEVKSVGQSRWGWKLVRLGSNKEEDYSSDEEIPDDRDGFTSDGKEIVAVWAGSSCWKMSGVGELQFRGSGLTGELGTAWALMVVMSCMAIWQKAQRDMAAAGAASSASSSSSAAAAVSVS